MNARILKEMILLPALALGCGAVQAHGAHEHGVAQMDVVQDGTELQIELNTPAANLVGFEHQPRNERERDILKAAISALEQGGGLFAPSASASCVFRDTRILSSLLSDEDEHAHGDHDHAHADVFIAWRFDCSAPAALREVSAQALFTRFPGMETIRVQAAVPRGQLADTLTVRKPILRF